MSTYDSLAFQSLTKYLCTKTHTHSYHFRHSFCLTRYIIWDDSQLSVITRGWQQFLSSFGTSYECKGPFRQV